MKFQGTEQRSQTGTQDRIQDRTEHREHKASPGFTHCWANYSGNRTAEPFLAPAAGKQCGHSARQTERGLVGAASASKGFQRFGPRDQKATAIWLQSWDGEKNYLPKVSALLERSDLTHKLPSSSELFLWLQEPKWEQGRSETLPRVSPEACCRHLWPTLRQEVRGTRRPTWWFQIDPVHPPCHWSLALHNTVSTALFNEVLNVLRDSFGSLLN